jgi:hypothetical protein
MASLLTPFTLKGITLKNHQGRVIHLLATGRTKWRLRRDGQRQRWLRQGISFTNAERFKNAPSPGSGHQT